MFEANEKRRDTLARLIEFVRGCPDGATVGWLDVTQKTGVQMNDAGKALFHLARQRAKRPAETIKGYGVKFSCVENALDIVAAKARRLSGALNIAKETTSQVSGRHLDEMPQDGRNRLIQIEATFAALSISASLAKKLPPKKT